MRALAVVARRTLAWLCPSVPPADRALVLAAMENPYPPAPAHGRAGEGSPWVGHTPEGEGSTPADAAVEAAKTPRPPVLTSSVIDTWSFR